MSEKVIITKEKLTTLGDKVRKIKGTSTKYTLDQINEELDNVSSGPAAEQWNGAYEEIVSGFTLTLNCTSDVLNSDTYMYSIDGGTTYNQFTNEVMTLENVTQIRFKTTASSHNYMKVGTTSGGGEVTTGLQSAETENITLSSDTAYYIGRYTQVGGAD